MSKYSELAERLVPQLPGGDITVPTVQTVVEAATALRELEAENERLRGIYDYVAVELHKAEAERDGLREEMQRHLPILEGVESEALDWDKYTKGTGIATLNGYRAALTPDQPPREGEG